ncbi:hypothetical protein DFH06DRAFT_1372818 [Mycena polygramma]|nr:hypothetical protein DFH06DRAFT_1372818 [Mycena polygramma]
MLRHIAVLSTRRDVDPGRLDDAGLHCTVAPNAILVLAPLKPLCTFHVPETRELGLADVLGFSAADTDAPARMSRGSRVYAGPVLTNATSTRGFALPSVGASPRLHSSHHTPLLPTRHEETMPGFAPCPPGRPYAYAPPSYPTRIHGLLLSPPLPPHLFRVSQFPDIGVPAPGKRIQTHHTSFATARVPASVHSLPCPAPERARRSAYRCRVLGRAPASRMPPVARASMTNEQPLPTDSLTAHLRPLRRTRTGKGLVVADEALIPHTAPRTTHSHSPHIASVYAHALPSPRTSSARPRVAL